MDQWQLTAFSFPFWSVRETTLRAAIFGGRLSLWTVAVLENGQTFFPVKPQRAAAVIYRIPVPALNLPRPSPVAYAHRICTAHILFFCAAPGIKPAGM